MSTAERMSEEQMEAQLARFRDMMKTPRPKREGFLFKGSVEKGDAAADFTIRTPREATTADSTLVVGGFGGIKPVYGNLRDYMAVLTGENTATMRRPRTKKHFWQNAAPDRLLHPAKIGQQSVVAMIDMMHERFGGLVTLVGHSMGGPNAVDAALRRPDKIKRVVMMGSGGLEEGQSTMRIARRGPAIMTGEILPALPQLAGKDSLKVAYEALHYMLRDPLTTIGEMIDVSNRPLMRQELRELGRLGIETHAVQFAEDRFFPLDEATRHTPGLVDGFHVLHGANHMSPITQVDLVAPLVGSIVSGQARQFAVA